MNRLTLKLLIMLNIFLANQALAEPITAPKGKIISPYEACKNVLIVSEDSYQKNTSQWEDIETKCKTKIQLATDVELRSLNPLKEGVEYLDFSQRVAKKIIDNLEKSQSYAECTASCFKGALNCPPDSKENKNTVDCVERKKEVTNGLNVHTRKIRIELALSEDAPGILNVNIQNVLSLSKNDKDKFINTNLRDFEIGTPNPVGRTELTARELKEAQRKRDREFKVLDDEFKTKGYNNYSDWMSVKLMERFDEHKTRYRQMIYEEAPIFGVIDKPAKFDDRNDPVWTDNQISDAFLKLATNSKMTKEKVNWSLSNGKLEFSRSNAEALKKWLTSFNSGRKDTNDLLFYMGMKNQVEEVLRNDPSSCAIATAMEARLRTKEMQNAGMTFAASLSTALVGKLAGGTFNVLRALSTAEISSTTGLALGSAYLGDSFRAYNSKTTEAATLSGIDKENEGSYLRSAEEISAARDHVKTALVFAPLDATAVIIVGKKITSIIARQLPKESSAISQASKEARLTSAARAVEIEHRTVANTPTYLGQALETITPYQFPKSMRLRKYRNEAGDEFLMYEKVVIDAQKKTVFQSREMSIDPLTGAYDANYPAGKLLLEDLIKEKQGKATFAFIDVNNLGYVNNNFAKGRTAGDAYLASIATAINKATEGKAQLFKLGGDEYGVIIHEADPAKAQSILQKIIDSCYSKEVHQGFRENSIARAEAVRASRTVGADGKIIPLDLEAQKAIKDYASYSREGISIGSASIKEGDTYESLLLVAEAQAVKQKIVTKVELNISAKKYGGADPIPGAKPNLKYKPIADAPTSTEKSLSLENPPSLDTRPNISAVKTYGEDQIIQEKYRFGEISVVEHIMPDGSPILKYNRFANSNDGARQYVTRELVVNSKVGFIDGTHESGKFILSKLADGKNAVVNNRGLVWINAENLGKINYFKNGTAAGDKMLALTAKTIEKELRSGDIPIKMQGSEFVILQNGLSKDKITALVTRIRESLINDPEIKKIYSDQLNYLQQEIRRLESLPSSADNAKKLAEYSENLVSVSKMQPQFTIEGHIFNEKDNLDSALKNTRGLHYKSN